VTTALPGLTGGPGVVFSGRNDLDDQAGEFNFVQGGAPVRNVGGDVTYSWGSTTDGRSATNVQILVTPPGTPSASTGKSNTVVHRLLWFNPQMVGQRMSGR
jgi:hypothetical protein